MFRRRRIMSSYASVMVTEAARLVERWRAAADTGMSVNGSTR